MKQRYIHFNFHRATLELIVTLDALIADYVSQGFMLSVRQLYYQCIARDIFPDTWIDVAYNRKQGLPEDTKNTLKNYKRLASILNDARLAGLLDWDAIEDRGRRVKMRNRYQSGKDVLDIAQAGYHMDHWFGQRKRVFVIVEKDALSDVLSGPCYRWDTPLLAARGYPSVSALRSMALTHFIPAIQEGQEPVILHLGDHDPSGIDMTRDLSERLNLFAGRELNLQRIALTMQQIEETDPPPNPAKVTDSRFKEYEAEHGDESWELDALEPAYLVKLLEKHIKRHVSMPTWNARTAEIEGVREKLKTVHDNFED